MRLFILLFGILLTGFNSNQSYAQGEDTLVASKDQYKVIKNDGSTYIGYILKNDAREVLLRTDNLGDVYIPKHEIKSMDKYDLMEEEIAEIESERNLLPSRYIQTTNGFPVKKGEGYAKFMLVGIDMQFAITDKWSMGGMTTWWGVPLVFTTKYSFNLTEGINASLGVLYGNLVYGNIFTSSNSAFSNGGGIGFGNLTFGDEDANLNVSAGYGFIHSNQYYYEQNGVDASGYPIYESGYRNEISGTTLISIAGMKRISKQAMFVFDSVINLNDFSNVILFSPAVRYMPKPSNIFQFGLGMGVFDGDLFPLPMPMISFYKVFGSK